MNTDHDKAEFGGVLPPGHIPAEQKPEAGDIFTTVPALAAFPLADFARRVRACGTPGRLDMLHTLMLRAVPVGQRAEYIALLNQRDEELSWQATGAAWWV
ncbi:hypothetical protein QO588_002548 [Salmonella enterica]|nr:hypothetical protein [Salmonella enterica]EGZ4030191.1 hypothetical protein [Salmonella enterica subsp. enterica serovar Javiana]HCX7088930.1 hypothetical protein [Salmonella enterica subsp. enterica]ECE1413762.1 hypothetical protein [Salmonella enterica]ELS7234277.1 hypothetical protein [Salmonella enterica]